MSRRLIKQASGPGILFYLLTASLSRNCLKALAWTTSPEQGLIGVIQNGQQKAFEIVTGTKSEQGFEITRIPTPDALQSQIYQSWIGENQ